MTKTKRVLAYVLAGGEGSRLRPFTQTVPKPALPFGSANRIIDFVLSNLYNSGIREVCVLLQYRPQILLEHLGEVWAPKFAAAGGRLDALLPGRCAGQPFLGTADAVRRNLHLVAERGPDTVAVFAADHIYRMDVRQMLDFHDEKRSAVTVAAIPVDRQAAREFGVLAADGRGHVTRFEEKPQEPPPMAERPGFSLASMGNYLFDPEVLRQALDDVAARGGHDFGRDVLPSLVAARHVRAYDFEQNRVPGVRGGEPYWRDVGGVDAYIAAHREILGSTPVFALDNPQWPIFPVIPAAALAGDCRDENLVGLNVVAHGARVRRSILQRNTLVEPDCEVENCILMEGVRVGRGARLRNTVVASGSVISDSAKIGYDVGADSLRFLVARSGTVVVPPGVSV